MRFDDLQLWQAEEAKMHECIKTALSSLINTDYIKPTDNEDMISGKLFIHLLKAKRQHRLDFMILRQVAIYELPDDAKPNGFPDIGFLWHDFEHEQHDYHIECKRLLPKRPHKTWDFCAQYIANGVQRYVKGIYGKNHLSGTMIAYVQQGIFDLLLASVNEEATRENLNKLALENEWKANNYTRLLQRPLRRDGFYLTHYWADFRKP